MKTRKIISVLRVAAERAALLLIAAVVMIFAATAISRFCTSVLVHWGSCNLWLRCPDFW